MKNFILALCLPPLLSIVFWNAENFFDYKNSGYSASDAEFSSRGKRHWTRKRFDAKTAAIGKTILWAGAPEIVGLAEVENDFVLQRLCRSDVLRKYGYRYVHYESQDPRGIDVALLYRCDNIEVVHKEAIAIIDSGDTLKTRDILYVCAVEKASGDTLHIFVNHHPSKYGGSTSEARRMAAMRTLKQRVDSLLIGGAVNIVAMGDFNDTPDGPAFAIINSCLVNLGSKLLNKATLGTTVGTIRFNGKWELIDNFLVSPALAQKRKMEILRPPFLLERDRRFPGDKPYRTFIGPRYNAGVSDHLPIRL